MVIGSEPPFKVKGLWLFRGQDIAQFVLDECYDMELYEWSRIKNLLRVRPYWMPSVSNEETSTLQFFTLKNEDPFFTTFLH